MNELRNPVYVRPPHYVGSKPFEGDLFRRDRLGDKLTRLVSRMQDGCVFAIDAPWGEGKTWFGKNWEAQLREHGHKTIFIDAFQQDYVEEPFLVIASEILASIQNNGPKTKLAKAGKKIGKALLPIGTKVTMAALSRVALGSSNAINDIKEAVQDAVEEVSKAAEKYVESRLTEHQKEKQSVEQFRKVLGEFAESQDKPVIFIIDELDRCKPIFAVQTIERIKHFFDVPHLVFVLLINREQIESAVRGLYGETVDAHAYLGKFIQFFARLPKLITSEYVSKDFAETYCSELEKRYGLTDVSGAEPFKNALASIANLMDLSLRDLERAYVLFSIAQPTGEISWLLAYMIALKLRKPSLYQGLIRNEQQAHQEASVLTGAWNAALGKTNQGILYLYTLHLGHTRGFENYMKQLQHFLGWLQKLGLDQNTLFSYLGKRIDLSIEE